MSSLLGASEIVLSARDIPAMVEFYTRVLRLTVYRDGDAGPDEDAAMVFLQIPSPARPGSAHPPLLALVDRARRPSAESEADARRQDGSARDRLAFEMPSEHLDAELARLDRLGLGPEVRESPDTPAKAVRFADPEGNPIELIFGAQLDEPAVPVRGSMQIDDRGQWVVRRQETVLYGMGFWRRDPATLVLFLSGVAALMIVGSVLMSSNDSPDGLSTNAMIGVGFLMAALVLVLIMSAYSVSPGVRRGAINRSLREGRCPNCRYDIRGIKPDPFGYIGCPECSAAWRRE